MSPGSGNNVGAAAAANTLISALLGSPMTPEKLALINKTAFNNGPFKEAAATTPLLSTVTAFATVQLPPEGKDADSEPASPSLVALAVLYAKVLRSLVVNCPQGRALCSTTTHLMSTLTTMLRLVSPTSGEAATEIITTLCAICMNDEPNCASLRAHIVSADTLIPFADGQDRNKADLEDKIKFIKALIET